MKRPPTLRIVRGRQPTLAAALWELGNEEAAPIWVGGGLDPWRSWSGTRQLLAQCIDRLGEGRVVDVLERHAGPARLLFDGWQPSAPATAERQSAGLAARFESHLTHNWVVQRPLLVALARLLSELLDGEDLCLVVPRVDLLDWESLALLKALYRLPRPKWPRTLVGYQEGPLEPQLDERGIEWRTLPEYVRATLLSFVVLPGARWEDAPDLDSAGPVAPGSPPGDLPPLVEGCEREAREILGGERPLTEGDCQRVAVAMETCFRRFAFTSVLRMGCELFDRVPDFAGEAAVRAHGVTALSAHNRQFSSQGNLVLGRFIAGHLKAALDGEERPRERCALLYRLAVAHGRRLGDIEASRRWADQAVAEATALETQGPRYQVAWAHNILAYVQIRSEDQEGSRRAMEAAADCAGQASWPPYARGPLSSNLPGDLALTRSLAWHNLAVSQALCGELDLAQETLETSCRYEAEIESSAKFWSRNLVGSLRSRHRPDLAIPHARAGLEAAETDREGALQLFFLLQLADLYFRLGDAVAASDCFLSARSLTSRMRPLAQDEHPDLELPAAAALQEAGRFDRAETLLRSVLRDCDEIPKELAAEIASRLAVLAARRGEPAEADAWGVRAQEAAMEDGHRHCLVRTATQVGSAARLLGRREEALDLFAWAFELSEGRENPESVAPADELRLLVELERSGALPVEKAARCFDLLPEALQGAASWWLLVDLLRLWLRLGELATGLLEPTRVESLGLMVRTGGLRADCEPLARAAEERLRRLGVAMAEPVAAPSREGAGLESLDLG